MNSLRESISGMQRTLRSAAGEAVTYRRGDVSIEEVTAIPGFTRAEIDDGAGGVIDSRVLDWLIGPAELVIAGELILPARGDRIVAQSDEGEVAYQVVPVGREPCFRRSGTMYRIHTQLVGRT